MKEYRCTPNGTLTPKSAYNKTKIIDNYHELWIVQIQLEYDPLQYRFLCNVCHSISSDRLSNYLIPLWISVKSLVFLTMLLFHFYKSSMKSRNIISFLLQTGSSCILKEYSDEWTSRTHIPYLQLIVRYTYHIALRLLTIKWLIQRTS